MDAGAKTMEKSEVGETISGDGDEDDELAQLPGRNLQRNRSLDIFHLGKQGIRILHESCGRT
jgi:hypothetical protein